ncbi:MAG: gamma carbonic anhydrase family protein [Rhodospirillaceae bacterium TMED8]|nr:gamma carbonic anhydrase family protein [Magnetovibrio sp.]OUT47744.1 MAG: gamma carbonic anhydrase family protein [Rhodospirillaceae bacterium TMED8]
MKFSLGKSRVLTHADGNWIAPNACVIGEVIIEKDASVWFNATLRGDNESIILGPRSNVQDGCVLHTDTGFPLKLEQNVTVGHLVMLHGCTIGANSLVGVGSVILNGAVIGENCLIGAGTLIPEGRQIPAGSLVVGQPGKVKRELRDDDIKHLGWAANHYVEKARQYISDLVVQD